MRIQEFSGEQTQEKVLPVPVLLSGGDFPKGAKLVNHPQHGQGILAQIFIPTPENETGEQRIGKNKLPTKTTFARATNVQSIPLPFADENGDQLRATMAVYSRPPKKANEDTDDDDETGENDDES